MPAGAEPPADSVDPPPADSAPRGGRGRPRGGKNHKPRSPTIKFSVEVGVNALIDLAQQKTDHWNISWDGKSYPKTKRSHGPNIEALVEHAPVLTILLKPAPNGYPDCYSLAATLEKLHELYHILDCSDDHLGVHQRAMLAADRWRIMRKHCVLVAQSKAPIPSDVL